MYDSIYKARRELFKRMDIPVTRADIHVLRWKHRYRLVLWEGMLRSLLVVKRLFDIVISCMALLLLFPVFCIVAVCIIIEDGYPVIYIQKRVGPFFKFPAIAFVPNNNTFQIYIMKVITTPNNLFFTYPKDLVKVFKWGNFVIPICFMISFKCATFFIKAFFSP